MDTQYREFTAPISTDTGHPEQPQPIPQTDGLRAGTAAAIRAARAKQREGVEFPLRNTAPGMTIGVRKLTMTEMAISKGLPASMHAAVMAAFKEFGTAGAGFRNFKTFDEMQRFLAGNVELASAMMILGAISPRVVATEAEAQADPDALWVGEIHPDDLTSYMAWCNGAADRELASRLKPFSGTRVGSAGTVSPDAEQRPTPIRPVGDEGAGVQPVGQAGL